MMMKRLMLIGSVLLLSDLALGQVHSSIHLKSIPKSALDKVTKKYPSLLESTLTPASSDKLIVALYETGDFENISISVEGGKTLVEGVPLKAVTNVNVKGANQISDKAVITALAINTGEKFKYQNLIDGADSIKDYYAKNGYYNTEVEITPVPNGNKVSLQVVIKENAKCTIEEIEFSTSFEDLSEQLKTRVKKFKNKTLSEEAVMELEETAQDYLKKNRILNASITGPIYEFNNDKTKVKLTFTIENPQKFTVFFEGNKYLSETEILDKLEIGEKAQSSSNPAAEISAKLERIYQGYGFANIKVKYTEINRGQTTSRKIYFTIEEGQRIYLKNIKFNGSLTREQKFYQKIFYETYDTGIYRQDLVKEALAKLLIALQNVGYLKSKILSQQVNFSEDKRRAEVQVYLDEGPQTIVRNINFKGLQAISATQLKEEIKIQTNSPLNLGLVENASAVIVDFYRSKGYLDAEVKTKLADTIKYYKDDTNADLNFEVIEGPLVLVNKIIIEGNSLTKNYVIINELEFDEGETLTPQKIADSEYHLQKTQLFSGIEILTLERGTNVSQRTVVIKVQERNPGVVSFGAGVTTEFDFTVRGYTSAGYNNLAGTARAISARAEVKQIADVNFIDHSVVFTYLEPTLFAKRTRGRIALIRAREIFTRTPETKALESNTANFFIEKDFSRYLKLTWNAWSISTNKTFIVTTNTVEEEVDIASIGPTLEWDRRDDPFVTRRGYFGKLSAEYAHDVLGSSDTVHYTRYDSRFIVYRPISFLRTTWATSLRGGYILNTEDQTNSHVPEIKQFKLGGRDTLRGFEPNEIPRETDKYGRDVQINVDSHYYLVNTEFRIPVYGNIETVLFYDGGSVLVRGFTFEDNYRDSVGVGFRYITPVGPLSVEYGHKLDRNRDLDESPYRIHLSFGTF